MRKNALNRFVLLLALVALLVLAGPLSVHAQDGPPGLQRAREVLQRHTPALLAIPDVVGTGLTLAPDGTPAVVLLTRRGGLPGLPTELEGVPVVVEVTGEIMALNRSAQLRTTVRWPRPVPIGVSTGHPDITAGTIGARVTGGGQVFALSNNHVYADVNSASIDDPVIQPGAYDGGTVGLDTIGTLYAFAPIVFGGSPNEMDAAIALTDPKFVGTGTPDGGYGIPSSNTLPAALYMEVQKYGRTTGQTFGVVTALDATVNVCYFNPCQRPGNTAQFVHQIVITPGTFSAGGDSGSLIVTQTGNNPVALLFAGSSTHTIASPIDIVLDRFGVEIDSSSAPLPPPNTAPTASFTYSCTDLGCSFDGSGSSDSDGTITSYAWTFGDGATETGATTSHSYAAADTYTVTLTVTDDDGDAGSVSQDVTVTAATSNDAPVAGDDSATTNEDTAVKVNVLGNDSDPDGDTLRVGSVTQGSNGSVLVNPDDNTVTYTPHANFNGMDSFTYTASDGLADSNVATVSIIVSPVNDPPSAVDDTYTMDEDTTLTIVAPGVLGNDNDIDGDNLSAAVVSGTANGSVTLNADGSFTYTPMPDYFGPDGFTYTASDSNGGSATATVSITVFEVAEPPANTPPTVSISNPGDGTTFSAKDRITFTGTASDPDDGNLSESLVWTSDMDGQIGTGRSFTTKKLSFNTHIITAAVTDSAGATASASVTITVSPN